MNVDKDQNDILGKKRNLRELNEIHNLNDPVLHEMESEEFMECMKAHKKLKINSNSDHNYVLVRNMFENININKNNLSFNNSEQNNNENANGNMDVDNFDTNQRQELEDRNINLNLEDENFFSNNNKSHQFFIIENEQKTLNGDIKLGKIPDRILNQMNKYFKDVVASENHIKIEKCD
jgi:hypothetical protein